MRYRFTLTPPDAPVVKTYRSECWSGTTHNYYPGSFPLTSGKRIVWDMAGGRWWGTTSGGERFVKSKPFLIDSYMLFNEGIAATSLVTTGVGAG